MIPGFLRTSILNQQEGQGVLITVECPERLFGKSFRATHGSFRSSDARFLLASVGLRPRVGP